MRLCGISSHFWLLSPCIRQVTHALLTRPPLGLNQICRSFNEIIPVRLACVKHAASVHPEPGSNSLIKFDVSRQPTSLVISRHYCFKVHSLKQWSSVFKNRTALSLNSALLRQVIVVLKNFRESYVFHCLVINVHCFSPSLDSLFTLPHLLLFVKNFFEVFQTLWRWSFVIRVGDLTTLS